MLARRTTTSPRRSTGLQDSRNVCGPVPEGEPRSCPQASIQHRKPRVIRIDIPGPCWNRSTACQRSSSYAATSRRSLATTESESALNGVFFGAAPGGRCCAGGPRRQSAVRFVRSDGNWKCPDRPHGVAQRNPSAPPSVCARIAARVSAAAGRRVRLLERLPVPDRKKAAKSRTAARWAAAEQKRTGQAATIGGRANRALRVMTRGCHAGPGPGIRISATLGLRLRVRFDP